MSNGFPSADPDPLSDQAIEVFQPYSNVPLTSEDAAEITDNLAELFQMLVDWKQADDRQAVERPPLAESEPTAEDSDA